MQRCAYCARSRSAREHVCRMPRVRASLARANGAHGDAPSGAVPRSPDRRGLPAGPPGRGHRRRGDEGRRQAAADSRCTLLSYLRLSGHRVGLLINFHVLFLKDGIRRIANGFDSLHSLAPNQGRAIDRGERRERRVDASISLRVLCVLRSQLSIEGRTVGVATSAPADRSSSRTSGLHVISARRSGGRSCRAGRGDRSGSSSGPAPSTPSGRTSARGVAAGRSPAEARGGRGSSLRRS